MPSKLNKAQTEAIEYIDGPLLIVAGAGTGKTRVITEKIAYLLTKKKVSPQAALALTFTEKSAKEMQDRVDSMMDLGYSDLHISTFHAFCQELLERYGLDIGLPNRFKILSETDAWLLVREHIYDFPVDYYRPLANPDRFIYALLKHFSKCKDELISPGAYLEYADGLQADADSIQTQEKHRLQEVARMYHAYNQLLLEKQSLDFGDLIFYMVKLLRERPHILKSISEQFQYILVDEFQDVNYGQYELVQLLAQHGQLTVVGDDDQSIYAFRGASVSNILRFQQDFPKAKEVVLRENYRSGQEILDAAYTLIQHNNPDRLEVKLGLDKKLISRGQYAHAETLHIHAQTGDDEVQKVIEEIARLKEVNSDISWDDFAILVRANSHAEPFLQGMERSGIPYEFLSSSGLYRQSIVVDCFHFLKAIDRIYDSLSIYHLLRLPFFKMSENDIQKFTHAARKKSITYYEALKRGREFQLSPEGLTVCDKVVECIHNGIKRARTERPTAVLLHFLEESGYMQFLTEKVDAGDPDMTRAAYHLRQFFDFVSEYEQAVPAAHVAGFIEYYTRVLDSGDDGRLSQPEETPDSVNVMTVHGAKGLEFRYVFVVNCVEQRFPVRSRGEAIELPDALVQEQLPEGDYHYQEERRLFYVAMTRAKERLYFTSAASYGGTQPKKISRFLFEAGLSIPDEAEAQKKTRSRLGNPVQPQDKILSTYTYQLPRSFSFSQLRAFEVCPYQYKMTYLLKIPMTGTPYFSFGTSMHLTLQRFYERVREMNQAKQYSLFSTPTPSTPTSDTVTAPSLEELLSLYEASWIDNWFENKRQREAYFKKGKESLKTFFTTHDGTWTIPINLEGGFTIKVGMYTVTGKIDRIDQLSTGGLHIIDYKTGETKEKIIGSDKDQLLLYQLAAFQLPEYRAFGKPEQLTYYYLGGNTQQSFLGTQDELGKLQEKILKTIEQIYATDFSKITKKDACGRCDFCKMCEFRNV